jgi:hypothetical protein
MVPNAVPVHAGGATGHHLLVDTLLGIGVGGVVAVGFLVFLRVRRRSRTEVDESQGTGAVDRVE